MQQTVISESIQDKILTEFNVQSKQYTTHINELISEPVTQSISIVAANFIYSSITSLYQLSQYLFRKKVEKEGDADLSFETYLQKMGEEFKQYGKAKNGIVVLSEGATIQTQLIRCYEKVDGIYFQQKYFLDLSSFDLYNARGERGKINNKLENIIEMLDLVQLNLFSQIHTKFHQYFTVAANFDYLSQSLYMQLTKLKQSRSSLQLVQKDFVLKSKKLRTKIIQRQNIQKILRMIKIIKSIKKLPLVMESILASSLPYQCLQLLQQTKSSLHTVADLHCLQNTSTTIKQMQLLAQNDLNRRYANQLYLYLDQCHSKEYVNLIDLWEKLQVTSCLDKENSFIMEQLNSSALSNYSDRSGYNLLSQLQSGQAKGDMCRNQRIARDEGKQFEIAMILIQSYHYVEFTADMTKIKITNALRVFAKRFEKQLFIYLSNMVQNQIKNRNKNKNKNILNELDSETPQSQPLQKNENQIKINLQDDDNKLIAVELVEKVSVDFYIKHITTLNDIFKQTINRFLGYLSTVMFEYQQEIAKALTEAKKKGLSYDHILDKHNKFKNVFGDECSLLPSIFKIVQEKIKYLLTLKNISGINPKQFFRWISTFKFWQRYFDYLVDEHPLLTQTFREHEDPEICNLGSTMISELVDIVCENVKKSVSAMSLRTLLQTLTIDYINAYHKNILNSEIINSLQEQTWQSVEIPREFAEILQSILDGDAHSHNVSITILDSSTSKGSISQELSRGDLSNLDGGKAKLKFKIFKNNIMASGFRFKVSLSLMLLCEWIEDYLRMARLLSKVLPGEGETPSIITTIVYDKVYELIDKYCHTTKQLILQTKALKFQKIKGKSINAKHICLLCNCLSFLLKISQQMLDENRITLYNLTQHRQDTHTLMQTHIQLLLNKLSTILQAKIDHLYTSSLQNDKVNVQTTTNGMVAAFLQMVEITDQYLDVESVKRVLKGGFQVLLQKYVTHLLLKGPKHRLEVEMLIEKIKFLKKYFPNDFETLVKEMQG